MAVNNLFSGSDRTVMKCNLSRGPIVGLGSVTKAYEHPLNLWVF